MVKGGLFVGLITLDLIYLSDRLPSNNQKLVAMDCILSAGGPATNAAVTFSHLGNSATVLGVLGSHPMTHLILSDLQMYGVTIADLAPTHADSPPVSSIIVTQATGERAVISINAVKAQATRLSIPANCLENIGVVLIDGHQMEVGQAIAQQAKSQNIPVIVDGGSWKLGFEKVLEFTDYAICSENFRPPNCQSCEDAAKHLLDLKVPHIAITHGEKPIEFWNENGNGLIEVPPVEAIDTLGAGDIFHGAFCHYILQQPFEEALANAAKIAAQSCQFFGTRRWLIC